MGRPKRIVVLTCALAALSLLLLIPIEVLTFTWKTVRDPTQPHVYLEDLKADGMRGAIAASMLVALWHSVDTRIVRTRTVLLSHGVIWFFLGAFLLVVDTVEPLPPPLVVKIGDHVYSVSRAYSPNHSNRRSPYVDGYRSILSWSVCEGTFDPCPTRDSGAAQDTDTISVGDVESRTPFLDTPANLAEYGLVRDGSMLVGLADRGEVIDSEGDLRVFAVNHPSKPRSRFVTVDPSFRVLRHVSCFQGISCSVGVVTEIGVITYKVSDDAEQTLTARRADEARVLAAIERQRK